MKLSKPPALLALLALLGPAACDDPAGPGPEPTLEEPVALPVLGQGEVTERYSAELSVAGGFAYTTTWGNRGGRVGNVIYVWDVAGARPELVDTVRVDAAVTLGDVEVVERPGASPLLVVATEFTPGSIVIYDLADPRAPRQVGRYSSPQTQPGVHTAEVELVDGRPYAFLAVDPTTSVLDPFRARLVVLDLGDPAAPREVWVREMGAPYVHDVFVRDGYLFTANWDEGLVIWDVGAETGSLAAPVELGRVQTVGGNAHNVWWFHDPASGGRRYAFVGEEQAGSTTGATSAGDVHVVDVSDPRNPREVAFFRVAGAGTHNFWLDEERGVLYAAYYNGGVRALDVHGDLGTCGAEQRDGQGRCDLGAMGREVGRGLADRPVYVWGVQQVGDVLYASDMHNGLWALDLGPLYEAQGR